MHALFLKPSLHLIPLFLEALLGIVLPFTAPVVPQGLEAAIQWPGETLDDIIKAFTRHHHPLMVQDVVNVEAFCRQSIEVWNVLDYPPQYLAFERSEVLRALMRLCLPRADKG
jgi:hypothetical protein